MGEGRHLEEELGAAHVTSRDTSGKSLSLRLLGTGTNDHRATQPQDLGKAAATISM